MTQQVRRRTVIFHHQNQRACCLALPGVAFRGWSSRLFAFELLGQSALDAFLFSGLQIIGVFLKLLDNAFLLNLSLEAPKSALHRLTFENPDLGQSVPPQNDRAVSMSAAFAQSNTSFPSA